MSEDSFNVENFVSAILSNPSLNVADLARRYGNDGPDNQAKQQVQDIVKLAKALDAEVNKDKAAVV